SGSWADTTPSPSPSADPSPDPSASPSTSPTPSPSGSPDPSSTPSPSPSHSPKPTTTPTQGSSGSPGARPTGTSSAPHPRRPHAGRDRSRHHKKPVEGNCQAKPPPPGLPVEVSPFLAGEPPGMQGPQSTDGLINILQPVRSRLHLTLQQALLHVAGPFPLAGPVHWLNDWHAYRPCPYPHVHEGLVMVAPRDTPIVAVSDATVEAVAIDPRMAGLYVLIRDDQGVEYDYVHLDHFAAGLRPGVQVQGGQVIGFVGNTGDA